MKMGHCHRRLPSEGNRRPKTRSLVDTVPREAVLKGKGVQEGNLKGTGAGCPYVPKDKTEGKKTSLSGERDLAGIQEKKFLKKSL